MIETEEQRRWWFATHPEYSWSRKGDRPRTQEKKKDESSKIDPKAVDAYVDRMLKYEDGPVADLLRSVKRNFGTEGNPRNGEQSSGVSVADTTDGQIGEVRSGDFPRNKDRSGQGIPPWQEAAWGRSHEESWLSLALYYYGDDAAVPRLPTTEELTRWPRELVRRFFQWLDALLQNNPLLINPDALERHHGLPIQFIKYFMDCGLDIKNFIIIMRAADHRLKPDGLHTGEGPGGNWNREWEEFIEDHPAENTEKRQLEIRDKLEEMKRKYGIDEKAILSPTRPKRR